MDAAPANPANNPADDAAITPAGNDNTAPAAPEAPKTHPHLRKAFRIAATPFRLVNRADRAIEKKIHAFADRHPRLKSVFNAASTAVGCAALGFVAVSVIANPMSLVYAAGYLAAVFGGAALALGGLAGATAISRKIRHHKAEKAAGDTAGLTRADTLQPPPPTLG